MSAPSFHVLEKDVRKSMPELSTYSCTPHLDHRLTLELPNQFQPELHLSRGGRGAGDGSGSAGDSGWGKGDQTWRVEVGPVENVKEFGAELQAQALMQGGVLNGGEVPCGETGADKVVARGVAPEPAVGRRLQEEHGAVPLRRRSDDGVAIEIRVGKGTDRVPRVAVV